MSSALRFADEPVEQREGAARGEGAPAGSAQLCTGDECRRALRNAQVNSKGERADKQRCWVPERSGRGASRRSAPGNDVVRREARRPPCMSHAQPEGLPATRFCPFLSNLSFRTFD